MSKKKKTMVKVEDIDTMLDEMKIPEGKARDAAKTYCNAKVNSAEGKCVSADDLSLLAHGYYDGYDESLRGG
jgi:hypothetical protein